MQRLILLLLTAVMMLFFTACRTVPLSGALPDGLVAEKISSIDTGAPFALSPDGNVIALVSSGFKLLHIPSKEQLPLGEGKPLKLAWSPFGNSLAALFAKEEGSSIVVYDQHGIKIAETPVNTSLTDLGWLSEDELVAGGVRVKSYKFGSNYNSLYVRWKPGRGVPLETGLRDTTLKPPTLAKWKVLLERGPMLDLSVQSGTILYLHPVDPPVFAPYYKLIMRDLASGKELEIASVGFESAGGRFSADGEKVLFGDGNGTTTLFNPWSNEPGRTVSTAGRSLALSPEGETWIADGALFRNGTAALSLAEGAVAQFSVEGSRAVIRGGNDLYLLSGLKPATGSMFIPAVAAKINQLRLLRLQGLVTPQEYKDNLLRIIAQ